MENVANERKILKYGSDIDEGKRYGEDLHYWSNGCGELHHWGEYGIEENELPAELQEMYHSLWVEDEFGLYCYLAEFKGQYGIALIAEYHEYECDGNRSNCGYEYAEKVSEELARKLPGIAQNMDPKILLAKQQGFPGAYAATEEDPATELVLFMPYGVTHEDFTNAGKLFGGMAYVWPEK